MKNKLSILKSQSNLKQKNKIKARPWGLSGVNRGGGDYFLRLLLEEKHLDFAGGRLPGFTLGSCILNFRGGDYGGS